MKEMEEEILTNWVCASTGWEWERSTLRQKEREKERKREMCVSGYHLWERKREQRKTWLCASVQVSHKGKAKRKVVRTARATLRSNLTDRIFLWARGGGGGGGPWRGLAISGQKKKESENNNDNNDDLKGELWKSDIQNCWNEWDWQFQWMQLELFPASFLLLLLLLLSSVLPMIFLIIWLVKLWNPRSCGWRSRGASRKSYRAPRRCRSRRRRPARSWSSPSADPPASTCSPVCPHANKNIH